MKTANPVTSPIVRATVETIAMRRSAEGDVDVTNARVRATLALSGFVMSDKTVRRRLHELVEAGVLTKERFEGRDEYFVKVWSSTQVDAVLAAIDGPLHTVAVSTADLAHAMKISWRAANGLLRQAHAHGWLERTERGFYCRPVARPFTAHPFDLPDYARSPLLRMQQGIELVDRDLLLIDEGVQTVAVPRYVWALTGLPGPKPIAVAWLEEHGLVERYGDGGSRVRLTDAGKAQRVPG